MDFKDTDYIQSIFNKILDEHNNMSSHLEYLNSLNDKEKRAIVISKIMLESSFSLDKCIGFSNFKNNK